MIDHRRDADSIRTRQRWIYLSLLLLSGLAVRPARANGLDIAWKRSSSTPTTRGAVVAFSPDGQIIASSTQASGNKAIELRRANGGVLLRTLILHLPLHVPDGEDISAITFSPDGRLLATSHVYGAVRLWRVSDGSLARTLAAAGRNIAFSPNGQLLATARKDGKVQLWRIRDGTLLRTVTAGRSSDFPGLAFASDGRMLSTSGRRVIPWSPSFDNRRVPRDIKLWRVSDGKLLRTIKGQGNPPWPRCLAFCPDGQSLAAGQGSQIWLWRVADGTLPRKLRFHHWEVGFVLFSPGDKVLVSGAADPFVAGRGRGEIAVWRARDGELLHTYDSGGRVWAAALSPDSHLIAYGLAEPATVVLARNPGEAFSEQAQTQKR